MGPRASELVTRWCLLLLLRPDRGLSKAHPDDLELAGGEDAGEDGATDTNEQAPTDHDGRTGSTQ